MRGKLKVRIEYIEEYIKKLGVRDVLDVGCGTGKYLTVPLAKKCNKINFVGYDVDPISVEHAKKNY